MSSPTSQPGSASQPASAGNPSSASSFSRANQRTLLAALAVFSVLAPLPLLIRHPQPPLPQLPGGPELAGGWTTASPADAASPLSAPPPAAADAHPFGRAARLGPSLMLVRNGGAWLLLTPMASWSHRGLDANEITRGIPALSLRDPVLRKRPGSRDEVATSKPDTAKPTTSKPATSKPATPKPATGTSTGSRSTLYQACLNQAGQLGHDNETLKALNPHPSAPLRRILRQVVEPASLPAAGFSCLLITTNAADVLDGSARSLQLRRQLVAAVRWPATQP